MTGLWPSAAALLHREVLRFFRQRNRIIGTIGTPIIFWFLIGSGLGRSFQSASGNFGYLEYFFPGAILLTVLFTSIFSTISVIEDRKEGFLQAVLVSPAPRGGIVLGKILGGTCLAVIQAGLFLLLAPTLNISLDVGRILFALTILALTAFGLTGLGLIFAWRLDSTQGFHAFMNLVLMPLWLLSGALFPLDGAPAWLGWAMAINPVTYAVSGLQIALLGTSGSSAVFLSSIGTILFVIGGFAVLTFLVALRIVAKPSERFS